MAVKLAMAWLTIGALAVGAMGCTTTQKVVSGVAMGGATGLLVAGPIGAAAGAAIGGVTVPVASAALSAD